MPLRGERVELEIEARIREVPGKPAAALVLIHGRGADENDLFPLFDMLDPGHTLLGACPRGPLTMAPGGAHWYIVRQVGFPDPETFFPTFRALASWLDDFNSTSGIPIENTVIGGFSQGAVMSYSLAFGADRPRPAGVLALSGFMPVVEGFDLNLEGLGGYPVAVGHGSLDPVIGVDFGRRAKERLTESGVDLTYRESPMGHTIDPGFLEELQGWLSRTLSPERQE